MNKNEKAVLTAIREAVEAGILAIGGVTAIKSLSFFPSATKAEEKKAA